MLRSWWCCWWGVVGQLDSDFPVGSKKTRAQPLTHLTHMYTRRPRALNSEVYGPVHAPSSRGAVAQIAYSSEAITKIAPVFGQVGRSHWLGREMACAERTWLVQSSQSDGAVWTWAFHKRLCRCILRRICSGFDPMKWLCNLMEMGQTFITPVLGCQGGDGEKDVCSSPLDLLLNLQLPPSSACF